MNQRKAGVILSYLNTGASSIIALVYIPLLLHYLTKDQYGIYQLMGSLIAYLSVMDFGLANTTTRYLSRAYAQKDEPRARAVISTSHALYLVIAGILLAVGGIGYFFITPLYGKTLSPADLITAKQIFLLMLANISITIPAHIFTATINAHEKFIFLRGLGLVKILLQPLLVWGVLALKASVLNLVLVQTGFNLFVISLNYFYCKTRLHVSFPVCFTDQPLMRELTGFSVFIFLHAIMDQVYWRLGQVVLGATSGAAAVAAYAIAMQIATFSIFLPANMSGVFLPKLSALAARGNNMAEINAIFCKVGRLQFMLLTLIITGFAFLGRTFLTLWVGPGYGVCYAVALIVMAGYILDATQTIGIPILQALKKHAFRAYVYISMAALNVVLCVVLGKRYGEIGCACATAVCLWIGSGVSINWYYAHIGLDLKRFFANLLSIAKGIAVAVVLLLGVFYFFPLRPTWTSFAVHGVILTAVYALCLWGMSFNSYEHQLLDDLLVRILPRSKKTK